MFKELDQLISDQVDYFRSNIDELNQILIDISKCQNNDQFKKIFNNLEKLQDTFTKKLNEHQNNIKNFIEIYQAKNTNSPSKDISFQHNFQPILGIDLGTSNSTVGYYRLNSRNRGEMEIVANIGGFKSIPSVVCIVNKKITVGEDAIKLSIKNPKNFIYDTKRMLGKKFDDPVIQGYRKIWTFDIVRSDTGGILIKVEDKYYEPYQISGMILIELMNLANSHINDQTNQAIITIPAYFSEEQIEDTKKAAKYANIELIELLKEPLAATFCYGYKTNNIKTSKKFRDILIYDFGGGTLDVSYVEVNGSSFNVLATSGDSNIGGQDFTNCIYEIIAPKLDEKCFSNWRMNSQFVNNVIKYCEDAKIKLSRVDEHEFYFDIPKDIAKIRDSIFEYTITREEFQKKTKPLFDRCMNPVNDVLSQVKRDPFNIESLVLVGGSSYLPMIMHKLFELTGKEAYHGVSAIDAVAFGACVIGGQYIQQKLFSIHQKIDQISDKDAYLLNMKINHRNNDKINGPVTATIGIIKYKYKQHYYENVIYEGNSIPYSKDILIYNTDVFIPKDKRNIKNAGILIKIPVYISINENKEVIHEINYNITSRDNFSQKSPLLKIQLTQSKSGIYYAYKKPNDRDFLLQQKIALSTEIEKIIGITNNKKESNEIEIQNEKFAHNDQNIENNQNSINSDVKIEQEKDFSGTNIQESNVYNENNIYLSSSLKPKHIKECNESASNTDQQMNYNNEKGDLLNKEYIKRDNENLEVPAKISIFGLFNRKKYLLTEYDKGERIPCKIKEHKLTVTDLKSFKNAKTKCMKLFLIKNEVKLQLPNVNLPISDDDFKMRENFPLINIKFEWDQNGFKCFYKNMRIQGLDNKLPIIQDEVTAFLYS